MKDMIVNLHLREMPEGDFLATLPGDPDFSVRGKTAGGALEKARAQLQVLAGAETGEANDAGTKARPRPPRPSDRLSLAASSEEEDLLRQMMILDHVEHEDKLSQRRLAELLNLNLSTVNQIVKRLVKKGYVKTRRLNGRSVAYYLTPQGFSEKLRLVFQYTRCTISFFANVRELVNAELAGLRDRCGAQSVSIVGIGELAEAAYLSAREQGLKVVGVHDQDHAGEAWLGYAVTDLGGLQAVGADIVIRADLSRESEAEMPDDGDSGPHVVDLAKLLSDQLGKFARRIDSESGMRDSGEAPKVAYG